MNDSPFIDAAEAEHFKKLAPDWWDPKGPCGLLHTLNPVRLQFILDRLLPQARTILDVGCGAGILSDSLARRGAIVTGIDVVPELLAKARAQASKNNTPLARLNYVETTVQDYAKSHAGLFDSVACMELLEHVPDPESLLQSCATLLKPHGKLFISTLNRHPKAYLVAILGAEYLMRRLPKHTHHYEKLIRPSELGAWLTKAGFTLQELCGIRYNPFRDKASLSKDVSVNYLAYAQLKGEYYGQ
jgi:2-polyprenyl-6-hydroxyphenyl methylase / 3-demethylubiquinone-9 3-methyltransferase